MVPFIFDTCFAYELQPTRRTHVTAPDIRLCNDISRPNSVTQVRSLDWKMTKIAYAIKPTRDFMYEQFY